ncbi:MAG: Zn-ribbon domain-containing OB-fold protein [Alphaproteobacteria bacterium]|jgi:hypothetical protein|nr:Zn-ribbon domain-containing OB-fold protein [Alphaproteobacteria bacterium]MDP6566257.1 Zn-ribbon domain-containing OB-fold protein [Alphaproteobacteria bacterium]MDP6814649.1 Zn-ribbon domain-containing OB-fold protein [Alphaproteobacteria bacterium]
MSNHARPLPEPDADSAPYWQGCREHRLLLRRCTDCGGVQFPPGPRCPDCGARTHDWVEASGRGWVFSWIVVHHPVPREVYQDEVPYVVALIELAEGPRLAANIVGCEPAAISAGMAVTVEFEDVTEQITLPRFRPTQPATPT